jgi:hypothetical protein
MVSLSVNAHSVTGVDADTSWQTMATDMPVETAGILSSRSKKINPFLLKDFILLLKLNLLFW